MGVLFGLASAITYGAADFLGGLTTKRTSVFSVIVVSQLIGSSMLLVALPFFLEGGPETRTLIFGALAGVSGAGGVGLFYKGLAIGRMSVVAPTTAVLSASFPVVFGLATGERPAVLAFFGVGLALLAVAFISSTPEDVGGEAGGTGPSAGLWHSLGAGIGFGLFFIFLAEAGEQSGMWPLVGARIGSLGSMVLAALVLRRSMKPAPGTLPGIAGAGLLDVAANIFYLVSTRYGLLSIVAVVTSMYPASTVLLARVVLKEKLYALQAVGLGLAALGIALIAAA